LIKDPVSFSAQNIIDPMKGTIEFWVQPRWDGNNITNHKYLLHISFNHNYSLSVSIFSISSLARYIKIELYNTAIPNFPYLRVYSENYPLVLWKANEWHKIQVFWDLTLPEGQQYITGKVDGHYFKYNGHAPKEKIPFIPKQSLDPNARIFIGHDPSKTANFNADAVIANLSIYQQSLLPIFPYPKYTYNPWKPETELPIRRLFENDGFCSPFENHNSAPNDCPKLNSSIKSGEEVLFFQKPAFVAVYEGTVPLQNEIKSEMKYQAAPGSFEDLFFNVYSRVDLNNVTVTYSDFTGPHGTIFKKNIDLRVVRNWFQGGGELPRYVPELLVHNDQIPLETVTPPNPLFIVNSKNWFIPSLPILDHVKTKCLRYTSKQFIMIVEIPENMPPGIYTSTATLKANGISGKQLRLNLEVLPFSLRDTEKKYGINYSTQSLDIYAPKLGLPWEVEIRKQLKDIKDHGMNGLVLYGIDPNESVKNEKLIKLMKEFKFKDLIIYIYTTPNNIKHKIDPKIKDLMIAYGYQPFFWGVDEVGLNYKINEHIQKSQWIHSIGGKVAVSTGKDVVDALDDHNNPVYKSFPASTFEPIDWPIINVTTESTGNYFNDLMYGKTKKILSKIWSYYWQAQQEDPKINRRNAGYHLMLTDLDGISPHTYMAAANDCYNEFNRGFAQCFLVYPSREGPIPTIQWEALRAGITDGKYLATWKYFNEKAGLINPAVAQASELVVKGILAHYKYADFDPTRVPIEIAQFDCDRQTIIKEIIKLLKYQGL
jgi:hypothetical protein